MYKSVCVVKQQNNKNAITTLKDEAVPCPLCMILGNNSGRWLKWVAENAAEHTIGIMENLNEESLIHWHAHVTDKVQGCE